MLIRQYQNVHNKNIYDRTTHWDAKNHFAKIMRLANNSKLAGARQI
jgi:hypothetical protein